MNPSGPWTRASKLSLPLLPITSFPSFAFSRVQTLRRYVPVLPLVLVNGAEGIGTGWSTLIPNFNPRDIVANLRRLIAGEQPLPMHPWYKNFKGSIEECPSKVAGKSYACSGVITRVLLSPSPPHSHLLLLLKRSHQVRGATKSEECEARRLSCINLLTSAGQVWHV